MKVARGSTVRTVAHRRSRSRGLARKLALDAGQRVPTERRRRPTGTPEPPHGVDHVLVMVHPSAAAVDHHGGSRPGDGHGVDPGPAVAAPGHAGGRPRVRCCLPPLLPCSRHPPGRRHRRRRGLDVPVNADTSAAAIVSPAGAHSVGPVPDCTSASRWEKPGRGRRRPATSPSGWAGAPSISTTVSGVTSTGASSPSSSSWSPCSLWLSSFPWLLAACGPSRRRPFRVEQSRREPAVARLVCVERRGLCAVTPVLAGVGARSRVLDRQR